ncbi:histidine kinase [Emticicia sp. SJ17W-69]|uniref:sensor histidine kinase n=1 Tax=Emticicia sp. SJ17W-69 TaxID=3421657 RepID=UPI003EBB54E6
MKNKYWFLLVLMVLLRNIVYGQEILIMQLEQARQINNIIKRDSAIVEAFHALTQCASFENERWRDSIKFYCNIKQNAIACLLNNIREADKGVNSSNGKKSIESLLIIEKELEKRGYFAQSAYAFMRIGTIYNYTMPNPNDKIIALEYYQKALSLAIKSKSQFELARAYDYLGEYFLSFRDYDKAIYYLEIAEKLQLKSNFKVILPTIYSSLAACFLIKKQIKKAESFYDKIPILFENEAAFLAPSYKSYVLQIFFKSAAKFFLDEKEFETSLNYCFKGLKLLDKVRLHDGYRNDTENYRLEFIEIIQKCYVKKKDFEKAYFYLHEYKESKDKLNDVVHEKAITEFNIKYQTDKSKLKITALENEKLKNDVEKQSTIKYFGSALIALLLLVISISFYSNFRLRQKNKEISHALLKGQTIERQRVAADLHDNLGSTLSALWLNVDMIDKSKMNAEEREIHQNLRENLEKAYNDVRLLSHNLLPEEFEKHGLTTILQGFVRKMNKNSTIKFNLKIDEDFGRVDNKIEFELYSICLELVNNIMKHSKASEAKIELSRNEKQIKLMVSDNGIGTFKNESDGKGMKNVKARVDSLNGDLEIESNNNIGTKTTIIIKI